MDEPSIEKELRQKKKSVLAYGEGEDEKIFLRHLVRLYCRSDKVAVATGSAGGGDPTYMLCRAIRARRGVKRDYEFILLDTDKPWAEEMKENAKTEGIELIGNDPCFESFLLDILECSESLKGLGTWKCKALFEKEYAHGNFTEEECLRLFPKSLLNSARERNEKLNKIVKIIEGDTSIQ